MSSRNRWSDWSTHQWLVAHRQCHRNKLLESSLAFEVLADVVSRMFGTTTVSVQMEEAGKPWKEGCDLN